MKSLSSFYLKESPFMPVLLVLQFGTHCNPQYWWLMSASGRVIRVREGKQIVPVEIVERKRKNREQKLIGAWTGRAEPEAIIMCFESLSLYSEHFVITRSYSERFSNGIKYVSQCLRIIGLQK